VLAPLQAPPLRGHFIVIVDTPCSLPDQGVNPGTRKLPEFIVVDQEPNGGGSFCG
jgi:hypothetical protein